MKIFDTLKNSKLSKKRIEKNFSSIICEKAITQGIKPTDDYRYFESKAIENLLSFNSKTKKCNEDLIYLWGLLEMRKYLDFEFRATINPYCGDVPVNELSFYLEEDARKQTLLDIKYFQKIKIDKIEFKDLYLATFEIKDNDKNNKRFRPYVELYQKSYDKRI